MPLIGALITLATDWPGWYNRIRGATALSWTLVFPGGIPECKSPKVPQSLGCRPLLRLGISRTQESHNGGIDPAKKRRSRYHPHGISHLRGSEKPQRPVHSLPRYSGHPATTPRGGYTSGESVLTTHTDGTANGPPMFPTAMRPCVIQFPQSTLWDQEIT